MIYNTWDYWVSEVCTLSGILMNTTFRKRDLFPSSGEGVGDTLSYRVQLLRFWILSIVLFLFTTLTRNIIIVLIYYRHKLLDLTYWVR
jgi:hypothetical protein